MIQGHKPGGRDSVKDNLIHHDDMIPQFPNLSDLFTDFSPYQLRNCLMKTSESGPTRGSIFPPTSPGNSDDHSLPSSTRAKAVGNEYVEFVWMPSYLLRRFQPLA